MIGYKKLNWLKIIGLFASIEQNVNIGKYCLTRLKKIGRRFREHTIIGRDITSKSRSRKMLKGNTVQEDA